MSKHVATLKSTEVFICMNSNVIPFYPTVNSTMLDIKCRNAVHLHHTWLQTILHRFSFNILSNSMQDSPVLTSYQPMSQPRKFPPFTQQPKGAQQGLATQEMTSHI